MKVDIVTEKIALGYLVKVKGDVDMNSSTEVREALGQVFRQRSSSMKALVVDLSQVRYMDSSGIATLVEALQTCMKQGVQLRLADLSPPVKDVFELARLAAVFEIYPSLKDAMAER
jgi:anti-sigma B factor antagonist